MMIYLPPSVRHFNQRFKTISTWFDHVPFGYDLVEAIRPRTVVELGTHKGLSFFTFCQSMVDHHVDGLCHAVDTWEGEEHTGHYDDTVYQEVARFARENYAGCAYLMRMLFDEAVHHFSDESIDLLHIDGLHTYEAVSNDFSRWNSKVKPGGIILFHDIHARMKDFGVWKFWEEISPEYEAFQFDHGFGLGVLRMPGGDRESDPTLLRMMFNSNPEEQAALRAFYVFAARYNVVKDRRPNNMGNGKGQSPKAGQ